MPDLFKLFAKTFLVIAMITFLASALMSGNLDPTSWDGHSFESSIVNTLGWIAGVVSAITFLIGLIAERLRKATRVEYDSGCVSGNWQQGHSGLRRR